MVAARVRCALLPGGERGVRGPWRPRHEGVALSRSSSRVQLCGEARAPRPRFADVEGKLKEIVAEQLGVEQSSITAEASFASDLGADSLDVVEMARPRRPSRPVQSGSKRL